MTKIELEHIKLVLSRIKYPDGHVKQAMASVDRKLAEYEARRGQLRDTYDYDGLDGPQFLSRGFGQ